MSKKLSICMALAVAFMFGVSGNIVHAQELSANVQPRGALCGDCNIGEMVTTYGDWGPWYVESEESCRHGFAYGTDKISVRTKPITSVCNYCGVALHDEVREYDVECHGYH